MSEKDTNELCNWFDLHTSNDVNIINDIPSPNDVIDEINTKQIESKEIDMILTFAKEEAIKLVGQIVDAKNDMLDMRRELKDIITINKELKDEINNLRHLSKDLHGEIIELRGLNEREKNLYVRSGIPFRFTPDRLFPFGHTRNLK